MKAGDYNECMPGIEKAIPGPPVHSPRFLPSYSLHTLSVCISERGENYLLTGNKVFPQDDLPPPEVP